MEINQNEDYIIVGNKDIGIIYDQNEKAIAITHNCNTIFEDGRFNKIEIFEFLLNENSENIRNINEEELTKMLNKYPFGTQKNKEKFKKDFFKLIN